MVFETEVKTYIGIVEIGLPVLFPIGLPTYADVGTIHGAVGIEGDMSAVTQCGLYKEALG